MNLSNQKTPADLFPKADVGLFKMLQAGNASPEAFQSAFRQLVKKTVPIQVRAEQRLDELFKEVNMALEEPKDRYRTLEEWERVRKAALKGIRLSRIFKVSGINYPSFFKIMYDTATHMMANMSVK